MSKWEHVKVQRRKLSSEISERIETMIVSGNLALGENLPSERELMTLLGVGRSSVREALFALSRKGLVTLSGGERPRVTSPTASHVLDEFSGAAKYFLATTEGARQFQDARQLFECAMARRAARQATPDQIQALRQTLEANLSATAPSDLARTDMAFHYAIATISGNRILTSICDALADWLSEQRTTTLQVEHAAEQAKMEHGKIFRAIEAQDPDEAEKTMADHLDEVAKTYWAAKTRLGSGRPRRRKVGQLPARPSI